MMKKMIASAVMALGLMGGVASADGFSFGFGYSDGHRGGYVGYSDSYYSGGGCSGGYWGGYSDCYRPRVCGHWEDRGYWSIVGYDCCGAPIRRWVSVRVWVND